MQLTRNKPDELLIWLYVTIESFLAQTELALYIERFSNNRLPYLTDAELLTSAIFPMLMGYPIRKEGYRYVCRHYRSWFPALPTYEVWNRRLNRDHEALAYLFNLILRRFAPQVAGEFVVDTFPVVVCQAHHSYRSRAAKPFVSKGYCAAKKKYYIGAKVEIVTALRAGHLPMPFGYFVATAKTHDLPLAEDTLTDLSGVVLYGDKAYIDQTFQLQLFDQHTELVVPVKKKKNQPPLGLFDQAFNTLHASKRQPVECLVSWMNNKTDIEDASKVRSVNGLFTTIALKMIAALIMLLFNL